MIPAEPSDLEWCRSFLKESVEDYSYADVQGVRLPVAWMTDDCGAEGSCLLYREAARDGHRVCLSGQGPDEIFADYPFWPEVSSLHGVFPRILQPWPNFQGGCQRAFLAKEEHIAGAFGIEARYPFLDRSVVQEFLWLTPDLKNSRYKAPLHQYLTDSRFAFLPGVKTGFSATAHGKFES
jgi:asparagine synthetase B (glutamine-hydrolysing)